MYAIIQNNKVVSTSNEEAKGTVKVDSPFLWMFDDGEIILGKLSFTTYWFVREGKNKHPLTSFVKFAPIGEWSNL